MSVHKKYQPIRSSRLVIYREHVNECLVLSYRLQGEYIFFEEISPYSPWYIYPKVILYVTISESTFQYTCLVWTKLKHIRRTTNQKYIKSYQFKTTWKSTLKNNKIKYRRNALWAVIYRRPFSLWNCGRYILYMELL